MHRWALLLWIVAPTVGVSSVGASQVAVTRLDGRRVRVLHWCVTADGRREPCTDQGHVHSLSPQTLRLQTPAGDELVIPRMSIEGLWVADGRRGHFWAGAAIGLLAGGLLGAVIGSTQEFCVWGCSPATALGVLIGVPAGFVLGGVTGIMIRSDRWRGVPVGRPSASIDPRAEAVGIGLSVAF